MPNYVKTAFYGAVVLLALYGVWALIRPLRDGDDRPPIIVADGSLDIKAADISGSGEFQDVDGDQKHWLYNHPAAGPKWLTVVFSGGAATAECQNSTAYLKVDDIKVMYTLSGGMADISVKNDVADILLGNPATRVNPNWLRISNGSVAHVEVFKNKKSVASCAPAVGLKLSFVFLQARH